MDPGKTIHILPFYAKAGTKPNSNYVDLSGAKAIIRGIKCERKRMLFSVYKDGVRINNVVFWRPVIESNNEFDILFDLISGKYKEKKEQIRGGNIFQFIKKNN